ncbi:MAG: FHA domain-containing protein [Nocardioides sp.]|nr:FHA domain-containing protein [Nocardioides sp.]
MAVVHAVLDLDLERAGRPTVRTRLRGAGSRLTLEIDDPSVFAGAGDAAAVRRFAEALAGQGIAMRVEHGGRHLVTLGDVTAPWWQRRVTGTRRIRLGSLRRAWAARFRAGGTTPVLPDARLLPPPTLLPLAPTLRRRPRRPVTTTHDPARGGNPRLVLVHQRLGPADEHVVHRLDDGMTIGSDPGCSIVLPDLAPVQARLRHDERDEWVVEAVSGVTRVHGSAVVSQILRTGTRVDVGSHSLVFARDEYADHGRPFGGRIGGEAGHQIPQPPREAIT